MVDAVIPELDRKGLRSFGVVTGCIVAALFGLLFPWLLSRQIPVWPWVLAGALTAWALAAPATLRPVYRGWMRFGLLMGRIMTPLLLGIVFVVVITPIARVRALLGRDSLARKLTPDASTYRIQSRTSGPSDLERPF